MLSSGMTKTEIEKDLQGKGNFVQIDHLNRFLKESLSMDTKKFVFLKLASLYEAAKLYGEAAKMYDSAASVSIAFTEKIKHYMESVGAYVRLGAFDRIEEATRKAMSEANSREREEIAIEVRQMYKKQAEALEAEMKRNHAVKFYEKLSEMRLSEPERAEIKERLLDLYKKTGKLQEYHNLERK